MVNRSLNILLVTYEFPPQMATGGISSYMHHLAGLLNKHGHLVTVFSATLDQSAILRIQRENCTNYLIPAHSAEEFRMGALNLFKEYIRENKVDVMESPEVGACALEIKMAFPGIPLIVKLHSPGVLITKISNTYQPFLKRWRFVAGALRRGKIDLGYWSKKIKNKELDPEYQICLLADQLLSPSKALKKWVTTFWGFPTGYVQVIPNSFLFNEAYLQMPLENRPKQVSFIGKLTVLKGMFSLTEAIPAILNQHPAYRICLVGRDEMVNGKSMKTLMEQKLFKYLNKVEFTGALPENKLIDIYGYSQVCIFPSLWENYPTVILEAMAGGAAVVASDIGGIPEIIENGITGMLFDPLKPVQLAKAVGYLLDNEKKRLQIAANARKDLQHTQGLMAFEKKIIEPYVRLGILAQNA